MGEKEFSLEEVLALIESYSFLYSKYPSEEVTTYLREAEALEGYTYYYPFSIREVEEDFLLSTKGVKVNSLIALKESYSLLYRERVASRVEGYLKAVEEREGLTYYRDTFYREGKLDKALLREDYYNYYSLEYKEPLLNLESKKSKRYTLIAYLLDNYPIVEVASFIGKVEREEGEGFWRGISKEDLDLTFEEYYYSL